MTLTAFRHARAWHHGLVLLALLAALFQGGAEAAQTEKLTVVTDTGRHEFQVEIADTDQERARGLMYRKSLPAGTGMLFDFRRQDRVSFWMKNTYVSLDMIFIRADGTVATIARATPPLSERTIPSNAPVRFVLEVVAGTATRIGLQPGDRVEHERMGGGR